MSEGMANEERLRAAIGPHADYYLRRWREMDRGGKSASWNWAACLANLFWFAWRKMWLALALFVLANIAIGVLGALSPVIGRYTPALLVGLTFITGAYGNLIYRRKIERIVSEENQLGRGGTSPLALGVAIVLVLAGTAAAVVEQARHIQAQPPR